MVDDSSCNRSISGMTLYEHKMLAEIVMIAAKTFLNYDNTFSWRLPSMHIKSSMSSLVELIPIRGAQNNRGRGECTPCPPPPSPLLLPSLPIYDYVLEQ